ncbi:hypothetical protein [Synechococcus sp. BS55D]|uniref:hypothetical protein n=1 Tax=Synechococcus sp. BS55D TaxID=2055943 RepID=UPI00103B3C5D|nr:hypothetical protein [Synechococcus sp. BS55D]TCD58136.1 hypothetical protein CWE16_02220 [Synechococcus sp. BS55D]
MFVTGCHRSGTSLLASLMHGLVCAEDPAARSGDLEVKLENPLGFFESQRLVEVNEELLARLGRSWETPPLLPARWDQPPLLDALQPLRSRLSAYALEQAWVDKDPRLCLTFPAYLHILLRRVPLVVALRDPLAVATSLHARNGFSLNRGLVIWLLYNHHIASQLSAEDLLVPYESLLRLADADQGLALQAEIDGFLERQDRPRPEPNHWRDLVDRYLRPDYNRAEAALSLESRAQVNPLLLEACHQRFELLQAVPAPQRLEAFREQFAALPRAALEAIGRERMLPEAEQADLNPRCQQLEAELEGAQATVDAQGDQLAQQQTQLRHLQTQLLDAQRQLYALQASRSWRLTAPLRAIGDRFRGAG